MDNQYQYAAIEVDRRYSGRPIMEYYLRDCAAYEIADGLTAEQKERVLSYIAADHQEFREKVEAGVFFKATL